MSVAHTSLKGVNLHDAYRAFSGVNLIAPVEEAVIRLIDMDGRPVHSLETGYRTSGNVDLLPDGHVLLGGRTGEFPLSDIDGAGGVLLEMNWSGEEIWRYTDPSLHDGFFRAESGNTFVIKWIRIPEEIAAGVQGGESGSERDGAMWGDVIEEITPDKEVVWRWVAHEHLDPTVDRSCPLCPRVEWTHAVSCMELPDGNILACFRKNDAVAVIDKGTGDVLWRWGPGELAHPQHASLLSGGNILLFDSGYHHAGINMANSRIVEVTPYSGRIAWEYAEGANQLFYSSGPSSAQRLPNGNTLVCEGVRGRIFEVSGDGQPVWEYVYQPSREASLSGGEGGPAFGAGRHFPVCAARRYGLDYSGLPGNEGKPRAPQSAPDTISESPEGAVEETGEAQSGEDAVLARLQQLGY